jgi:hypothetical protein
VCVRARLNDHLHVADAAHPATAHTSAFLASLLGHCRQLADPYSLYPVRLSLDGSRHGSQFCADVLLLWLGGRDLLLQFTDLRLNPEVFLREPISVLYQLVECRLAQHELSPFPVILVISMCRM